MTAEENDLGAAGDLGPSTIASPRPVRVQRSRAKGWRMPEGAVYVGRPSLWGNTWTWRDAPDWIVPGWDWTDEDLPPAGSARAATREDRAAWAVARYREELEHFGLLSDYAGWVSEEHWRETNGAVIASGATNMAEYVPFALRGKTLVCWCPLDAPCHADVLLELANR